MIKEKMFIKQIKAIINEEAPLISNLSNISRILFEKINGVSWSGFYLYSNEKEVLYLGPYQGPLACTTIEMNKGVCGTSAYLKKTINVPDVHAFPGHIACSSLTNSEIVVPIIKDGEVCGVIDLDSNEFNNFDEQDQNFLEEVAEIISQLF